MNYSGQGWFKKGPIITVGDRAQEFWSHVQKGDGCWLWTGKKNPRHPYGQFYVGWDGVRHREWRAHRAAWALANGPIPDGLHVCHSCDVPLCVNPAHLFTGTRSDNMRDCVRKGRLRSPFAAKTQCKRGHEFTPENTTWWKNKKKCRTCTNQREQAKRSRFKMAI